MHKIVFISLLISKKNKKLNYLLIFSGDLKVKIKNHKIANSKMKNKLYMLLIFVFSTFAVKTQTTRNFFPKENLMSIGIYYYPEHWDKSQWEKDIKNISEIGFSLGFGYKFKTVGNQIDFTYHSSLKDHSNSYIGEELFRGFQIGISIADIWFIKRRQR